MRSLVGTGRRRFSTGRASSCQLAVSAKGPQQREEDCGSHQMPASVWDFLESIDLGLHAETFRVEGFEHWREFFLLSDDDLREMGLKKGHRLRLLSALKELATKSEGPSPQEKSKDGVTNAASKVGSDPAQSKSSVEVSGEGNDSTIECNYCHVLYLSSHFMNGDPNLTRFPTHYRPCKACWEKTYCCVFCGDKGTFLQFGASQIKKLTRKCKNCVQAFVRANEGSREDKYEIGRLLLKGTEMGLEPDYEKARLFLLGAAHRGHPGAKALLNQMDSKRIGVRNQKENDRELVGSKSKHPKDMFCCRCRSLTNSFSEHQMKRPSQFRVCTVCTHTTELCGFCEHVKIITNFSSSQMSKTREFKTCKVCVNWLNRAHANDAEALWKVGAVLVHGNKSGVAPDKAKARHYLEEAARLGKQEASLLLVELGWQHTAPSDSRAKASREQSSEHLSNSLNNHETTRPLQVITKEGEPDPLASPSPEPLASPFSPWRGLFSIPLTIIDTGNDHANHSTGEQPGWFESSGVDGVGELVWNRKSETSSKGPPPGFLPRHM
eukprot:g65507.t1